MITFLYQLCYFLSLIYIYNMNSVCTIVNKIFFANYATFRSPCIFVRDIPNKVTYMMNIFFFCIYIDVFGKIKLYWPLWYLLFNKKCFPAFYDSVRYISQNLEYKGNSYITSEYHRVKISSSSKNVKKHVKRKHR